MSLKGRGTASSSAAWSGDVLVGTGEVTLGHEDEQHLLAAHTGVRMVAGYSNTENNDMETTEVVTKGIKYIHVTENDAVVPILFEESARDTKVCNV